MGRASYALQGVLFFLTSPKLWVYALCPLICCAIFALVSLILLFALALVPQSEALQPHMPEWLAWIIAESFVALFIFAQILFNQFQEKMFDKTMELKGVKLADDGKCCENCGVEMAHFIFGILLFVVTLPLNAIPVLGTVAFCFINGWHLGWELHEDYFEKKNLTFSDQWRHMIDNAKDYTTFGAACQLLSIIPLLNFLLIFTNFVSAALWAADMELGKAPFKTTRPELWSTSVPLAAPSSSEGVPN